ncbi:hypothetical protein F5B21DRAFT_501519 [Xylaria acuta]|nr:hypothetical protein F5B21DRAFT_501519 [Xylaria acuta]
MRFRASQEIVHDLCTMIWIDMFHSVPAWPMYLTGLGIVELGDHLTMAKEWGALNLIVTFAERYPVEALQLSEHNDISYIRAPILEKLASVDSANALEMDVEFDNRMKFIITVVDGLLYTRDAPEEPRGLSRDATVSSHGLRILSGMDVLQWVVVVLLLFVFI